MYSKQEKLAAARRKLKEFQGKQRENFSNKNKAEILNTKTENMNDAKGKLPKPNLPSINIDPHDIFKNYDDYITVTLSHDNTTDNKLSFNTDEENKFLNTSICMSYNSGNLTTLDENIVDNYIPSITSKKKSRDYECMNTDFYSNNYGEYQNKMKSGQLRNINELCNSETMPQIKIGISSGVITDECNRMNNFNQISSDKNVILPPVCKESDGLKVPEIESSCSGLLQYNIDSVPENYTLGASEENVNSLFSNKMFNAVELQNVNISVPSTSQLCDERNNLLQVLKNTEEFLKYKSDQVDNIISDSLLLKSQMKDLEEKYVNTENEIKKLREQNKQLMSENEVSKFYTEELQKKYDAKEEQFCELQQKFQLTTNECEQLNLKLQEVQKQLSSSLIKIQQLTVGESPSLNMRFNELQSENSNLIQRIHELENNLEILNKEKEQSSHNFQSYAQQCNSQISSLSGEMRNISKENEILTEKNKILEKNLKELENEKLESAKDNSKMIEISNELSTLHDENKKLQILLSEKMDEIESLQKERHEKLNEIQEIHVTLQEVKSENLKLLEERESNDYNKKLLAAMESDKVAAARAVAQNQKLKDQISELEEGFIKLSHEKLHLTDELAREKHLKNELELLLKELEQKHSHEENNCPKSSNTTINESADVEELKCIIHQLENDKTELISRLNCTNVIKTSKNSCEATKDLDEENSIKVQELEDDEGYEENKRGILQQMEEKIKKTMNEIAALNDEKEKLEHLVLQLQGETETIGEYISLYQTQRLLLRQRNKEKDEQLLQLARDKDKLKSKLLSLKDLIHHLLAEKGIECNEVTNIEEVGEITQNCELDASESTAEKIQALISEIQSTSLIDNQSIAFEHCPCCSGRLINI